MIDLEYIFNRVTWHLKRETLFFTSGELRTMIGVDAFRRLAEDIHYPKSNFSTHLASGVWYVNLSSDFVKIDETSDITFQADISGAVASGQIGLQKLLPKTKKLIGRDEILAASPGSPEYYFMEDQDTLGFYPPCTGGTMVIPYVKLPTSLSSDTDTNELTERGYQAAIYWTVTQCLLMDDDERYLVYQRLYDNEVARLNRQFNEMFEEDKDIIPDEDYLV